MNYVWAGIIGLLLIVIAFLTFNYVKLSKDYADCSASLANRDTILDVQNKQIEQQRVDIEKYKEVQPQVKEKIVTKYKTIDVTDIKCEAQLKSINNAIDLFYENHYKAGL